MNRRHPAVRRLFTLLLILIAGIAVDARAHAPSLAYLELEDAQTGMPFEAVWDIALTDLDLAADLDTDRDGAVTWGELRPRLPELGHLVLPTLGIGSPGHRCQAEDSRPSLVRRGGDAFLRVNFRIRCAETDAEPRYRYSLFEDLLPGHRVLVRRGGTLTVWRNDGAPNAAPRSTSAREPAAFVLSGIHHILIGWDHLAFIVATLIGATLVRGRGQPSNVDPDTRTASTVSVSSPREALGRVSWLLTVFTIAHSVTLALAVFDVVSLPGAPVEAAIAASIVFAGGLNLQRRPAIRPEPLIFAFGLVHGLGFARVMQETGAGGLDKTLALLGFNLGVEIGQVVFAAVLLLPLLAIARHPRIASGVAIVGSLLLMMLGVAWFVERTIGATVS